MANLDLQIKEEEVIQTLRYRGRGRSVKKFISALRASVWYKFGGGWGPQAPPLDPPLRTTGAKQLRNACVVRELINRSVFFFQLT